MSLLPHRLFLLSAILLLAGRPWAWSVLPQGGESPPGSTEESPEEVAPLWTPEESEAIELLRSLRRKQRPDDAELAARLSKAGARMLPLFYDILASRSVPALEEGGTQVLSEVQKKAVLSALWELDRDTVLSYVGAVLVEHPEPAYRCAAIDCIGAVGRANDLSQLFELALGHDEKTLHRALGECLQRAVATLIPRDERTLQQLLSLRRLTRPELVPTLIEAVGAARDPRGLAYLSEVVYWDESLATKVMSQVAILGPSRDEGVDSAMRVRLRAYLDEERPGPARSAIVALTALRDVDSIAALVDMLGSEDRGLRNTAHWSLKQLTGLSLAPTPEVWARWHQAELFWMVRAKPKEFRRLREKDPAVVADAMRTLLMHPLALTELRAALPDLLMNRWPAIRVLTCRTLADLSAGEAVSRLVWALEDPNAEVVVAAHKALGELTGLDLAQDPAAWQEATDTRPRDTRL